MPDGSERTFLQDGDTVKIRGLAERDAAHARMIVQLLDGGVAQAPARACLVTRPALS